MYHFMLSKSRVGYTNLPTYFATKQEALKMFEQACACGENDGVALVQGNFTSEGKHVGKAFLLAIKINKLVR